MKIEPTASGSVYKGPTLATMKPGDVFKFSRDGYVWMKLDSNRPNIVVLDDGSTYTTDENASVIPLPEAKLVY